MLWIGYPGAAVELTDNLHDYYETLDREGRRREKESWIERIRLKMEGISFDTVKRLEYLELSPWCIDSSLSANDGISF